VVANATPQQRAATVTVQTAGMSRRIAVIQDSTSFRLTVSPAAVSVESAIDVPLTVTANTPWTVQSSASWCTPSPVAGAGNQPVSLVILANEGPYRREATVTFTGENCLPKTVTVNQKGNANKFVSVTSGLTIRATPALEKYQILIESNVPWNVDKEAAATWYSVTPASGANNGTVTVTMHAYHPTVTWSSNITVSPVTPGDGESHTIALEAVYEGVNIGGLIWAPTDVDNPGEFTAAVGKAGKFYQFDKAIPYTDGLAEPNWWGDDCNDPVSRGNNDWDETTRGVCPQGWRMPSYAELLVLLDNENAPTEYVNYNGYDCYSLSNGLLYFSLGRMDCKSAYRDDFGVWTKTSCHGAFAWEVRGGGGWYTVECNGSSKGNKTRGLRVRCVKN
jgi:uncharacterized protein (TIGR02145 family)